MLLRRRSQHRCKFNNVARAPVKDLERFGTEYSLWHGTTRILAYQSNRRAMFHADQTGHMSEYSAYSPYNCTMICFLLVRLIFSRQKKTGFFWYAKTKAQKLISAFVFATSIVQSLYFLNLKLQAIFSNCAARFVFDLVGNPDWDRFSQNEAQFWTASVGGIDQSVSFSQPTR